MSGLWETGQAIWASASAPLGEAFATDPVSTMAALAIAAPLAGGALSQTASGGLKAARFAGAGLRRQKQSKALTAAGREDAGTVTVVIGKVNNDRGKRLRAALHAAVEQYLPDMLLGRRIGLSFVATRPSEAASLVERGADIVIEADAPRGQNDGTLRLFARQAGPQNVITQPIHESADLEATGFARWLAWRIGRVFLPATRNPDGYRPERLEVLGEALLALHESETYGLEPIWGEAVRQDLALIARSVGERTQSARWLHIALGNRLRELASINAEEEPTLYAHTQLDAAFIQSSLGLIENDSQRLRQAVKAFDMGIRNSDHLQGRERLQALMRQADTLDGIARLDGDLNRLIEGIGARRQVLQSADALPQSEFLQQLLIYAKAQRAAGEAMRDVHRFEDTCKRLREASPEALRDTNRAVWSDVRDELGATLCAWGTATRRTDRFEEAIRVFQEVLKARDKAEEPERWVTAMTHLGHAYQGLAKTKAVSDGSLDAAAWAYREALKVADKQADPLAWARLQNNLGTCLQSLGERVTATLKVEAAVHAYREALDCFSPDDQPFEWAGTWNNLGNALHTLGERRSDVTFLKEAVHAQRKALEGRKRSVSEFDWAAGLNNLGLALTTLGSKTGDDTILKEAVQTLEAAIEVFEPRQTQPYLRVAQSNLQRARSVLAGANAEEAV